MLIRCWGSRGSIPVSGSEYIKYGGDTTCLELRTKEGNIVIIDAGSGIRRLGNNLVQEGRKDLNILFTHAHWDHILGFPFFKPLYFKGTEVSMLGSPLAQESIKNIISKKHLGATGNLGLEISKKKIIKELNLGRHDSFFGGRDSVATKEELEAEARAKEKELV